MTMTKSSTTTPGDAAREATQPIRPRKTEQFVLNVYVESDESAAREFDDSLLHLVQQLEGYHGVINVNASVIRVKGNEDE